MRRRQQIIVTVCVVVIIIIFIRIFLNLRSINSGSSKISNSYGNVSNDTKTNITKLVEVFFPCSQVGLDSYSFEKDLQYSNFTTDEDVIFDTTSFPRIEMMGRVHDFSSPYITDAIREYEIGNVRKAFDILASKDMLFQCRHWKRGYFFNPLLESLIWKLSSQLFATASKVMQRDSYLEHADSGTSVGSGVMKKILHIATEVYDIGGHSRVLANFIKFDKIHSHGIFLTRNNSFNTINLPDFLAGINPTEVCPQDFVECVKRLRSVVVGYDLVVLHIHMHDLLPVFAFSADYNGPPIAFFDHADHEPWVGSSIIDARLTFRKSGYEMYQNRGIEKIRNFVIPLPANHIGQNMSRESSRQYFGFREDDIVLLSMSREPKFGRKHTLLNMILPILKEYPNAVYVVVSRSQSEKGTFRQMQYLCAQLNSSQCRILEHNSTSESSLLHMAVDIHIDSFPVSSILSVIESLMLGSVSLGFCPYEKEYRLFCLEPNDPGLALEADKLMLGHAHSSCPTVQSYQGVLRQLLSNPERLHSMKKDVVKSMQIHYGNSWGQIMIKVYESVTKLRKLRQSRIELMTQIFKTQDSAFSKSPQNHNGRQHSRSRIE